MLDYGLALASQGRRDVAKDVLRGALEIFSKRQMKPLEGEAQAALRPLES